MADTKTTVTRQYGTVSSKYNVSATTARHFASTNGPLLNKAVGSIPYKGERAFTICDYGAADGAGSFQSMESLIREVKKVHGKDTVVVVIFEDQATNDFTQVFLQTQGSTLGAHKVAFNDVYYLASGTSFYEQCCPPSSVHLGYTNLSIQWISNRPCTLSNTALCHLSSVDEEWESYQQQAARDWNSFLLARAKELVPGGVMVMSIIARDSEDKISTSELYKAFDEVWKSMWKEGIISLTEYQNTNLGIYFRNETELRAPFVDANGAVCKAGLILETCEMICMDLLSYGGWLQGKASNSCTAADYAKLYATCHHGWGWSSFLNDLDPNRASEERLQIVQTLYQRIEDRVASEPHRYPFDYVLARVSISKVNN